MEGFRRGSHNYIIDCYKICQTAKLSDHQSYNQYIIATVCTSNVTIVLAMLFSQVQLTIDAEIIKDSIHWAKC